MTNKKVGQFYEQQAACFLVKHGLQFLAKNITAARGEIDLVMQEQNCIVFIEVKYRRHQRFGGAAEAISQAQQQRMLNVAYAWLEDNHYSPIHTEFRFDAVIYEGNVHSVNWVQNILIEG